MQTKKINNFLKHFLFLFLGFAFWLFFSLFSQAKDENISDREIINSRIKDLKKQIEMYQEEIDQKSEREESLKIEIGILEADIRKIELQIEESNLQIAGLESDILFKEMEIKKMQEQVNAKERMLVSFLQELYEKGGLETTEIIFTHQSFSEYYAKIENLESIENQIKNSHDQLEASKNILKKEKENLIEQKMEKEEVRGIQSEQERAFEREKQMRRILSSKIQSEKQFLEENMSRLQGELNALQSLGEPISIEEAVKAAKYASKITGVAPEFLLGVLRVESGLGTNVGGGRYKTDMNPDQWDTFKSICKELGLNPDKTPVSKRTCYNRSAEDECGGWGGAMGPAQFLPSTWLAYKGKVEKAIGKKPANPWDIEDSLVAMGFKLGSIEGVKEGNRKAWAKAAGIYLAGSNWEKYSWYSDRVLYYAEGFRKILKNY